MNKYDNLIVFILLKICKILTKYSSIENGDTIIYTIEKEIKGEDK